MSRWLLEAIRLAYASKGAKLPGGLKAHSTRTQASSWALTRGVSVQEVSLAANWSSAFKFADFYKLDLAAPSLAHAVLGWLTLLLGELFWQHGLSQTNSSLFLRLTKCQRAA